jgi:hypothetical protein
MLNGEGAYKVKGCSLKKPCAGAVYRGPYLIAEAQGLYLMFAVSVHRTGRFAASDELSHTS